jgi:polyvinyl alcohol dehydrogenase (cytochrome)
MLQLSPATFVFFVVLSFSTLFSFNLASAETPYKECAHQLQPPQMILSSGWSNDLKQSRTFNKATAGLSGHDLTAVELQWSFVFDDTVHPRSVPAVTNQSIILGSEEGAVLALDRHSGCGFWRYQAEDEVRTGISIATVAGRQLVFFGDLDGFAYAIDATTGKEVWKRHMDEHPITMITGSPVYYQGVLYVPLSSYEAAHAMNPFYNCCTFRGGVHAVDASTGKTLWKTHTVNKEPELTGRNILFVRKYGPSGAPVWSAPTIDEVRGVLYVGSGQNYSSPTDDSSDAIMAMDLKTGELVWRQQLLSKDAWNVACLGGLSANCPEEDGPDFDFGAPPILVTNKAGNDVVIAGQKSGMVYALNPNDKGKLLWSRKVGRGGILGGVHWGLAAADDAVYVPISDADLMGREFPGERNPSITKLDLNSGEIIWQTKVNFDCTGIEGCRNGLSAAITVIDGAVIAPGLDGVIHAYATNTGEEIWTYDTKRTYHGVNGLSGKGGTLDAGGVVVVDGLLLTNSGYGGIVSAGGLEGNVFLVFALPLIVSNK